jgi:hypothetical protein
MIYYNYRKEIDKKADFPFSEIVSTELQKVRGSIQGIGFLKSNNLPNGNFLRELGKNFIFPIDINSDSCYNKCIK